MAIIALKDGLQAIVDDQDTDLTRFKWEAKPHHGGWLIQRVFSEKGRRHTRNLRRIILERKLGEALPDDIQTDHIDGNTLNCRRDNLRPATASQNAMNRKTRADSKSKHKGVWYNKRKDKWRAYIKKDGIQTILGNFDTIDEAILARAEAEREMFGEYAR